MSRCKAVNPLQELRLVISPREATQEDIFLLSSIIEGVLPDQHHTLQVEQLEYRATLGASFTDYILGSHMWISKLIALYMMKCDCIGLHQSFSSSTSL